MDYAQVGVAVGSSVVVIAGGIGMIMKWGSLFSKINKKCPDNDCQLMVVQTHTEVKKVTKALFGEDGTGGVVLNTLRDVEHCVRELAKKQGINPGGK